MYRITHPRHGAMHVYDNVELERHKKLGWSIDEPEKKPAPEEVVQEIHQELKRGPGRPKAS